MPFSFVDSNPETASRSYYYAALTHCCAIIPIVVGYALAMWDAGFGAAVWILGELVVMGVLPRLASFRRRVDSSSARRAAVGLRSGLLGRMSEAHRTELEELERLADGIRERCGGGESRASATGGLAVERWLALERLLALYVELTVEHGAIASTFGADDRAALDAACDQMEKALASDPRGALGPWLERRSTVLERRRATWQRVTDESNLLDQALATIADVIRWMHEICATVHSGKARSEVEELLAAWESHDAPLREVCALCSTEAPAVDPAAMALGRDEMAWMKAMASRATAGASTPTSEPTTAVKSRRYHKSSISRATCLRVERDRYGRFAT